MNISKSTDIKAILTASLMVISCVIFSSQSHATKLYKWVDDKGKISYQDRPPPKNAKILEEREINAPTQTTVQRVDGESVVVYTLPNCQRCTEVLAWLEKRGVPALERSLQDDRAAQQEIIDLSNGLTAPALFLDDQFILDTSEEFMLAALREAGYTLILPEQTASQNEPQAIDAPADTLEPTATPSENEDDAPLFDENFNEIVDEDDDEDELEDELEEEALDQEVIFYLSE